MRFIKAVPCNWRVVTMPIFRGEESETALAEPFEAPALAAFPEFAHVNFGPVHLIGAVLLTSAEEN